MFEPYAFQQDIRDYAFYVNEAAADQDIAPFGSYESYSQEDYYKNALTTKTSNVSDPYEYNGATLVTYESPILNNGKGTGRCDGGHQCGKFQQGRFLQRELPQHVFNHLR